MSGGPSEESKRRDWSPSAPQGTDPVRAPDFGSFLRQVFPEVRTAEQGVLGSLTTRGPSAGLRRDYETAFTLLQRASDSFPVLLQHCQKLEAELRRQRAEADTDLRSAQGETQQWQQVAFALKMHVEECEHQMSLLRKRLASAEERLATGQSIAQAAEKQATLAIGITTLFHDKIVDAFGVGSPAHSALDAIANGAIGADDPGGRIR